jgi:hypothetical protein
MCSRPLCGPPDQGGTRTVERTTMLIRAMDKHRRDARPGRSYPNKGCALRPAIVSPNVTMTSDFAGHCLCGAPRRNRTGDPILTMEPPGTAVRTAIPAGHARPSEPKLSVLFRRSYALTFKPCADRLAGVVATPVESPVDHPRDAAAGQLEHRCHRQGCPGHRRSRLWWPGQHPLCFSHCRISRSIPHHGRIAPDRSVSRPSAR